MAKLSEKIEKQQEQQEQQESSPNEIVTVRGTGKLGLFAKGVEKQISRADAQILEEKGLVEF